MKKMRQILLSVSFASFIFLICTVSSPAQISCSGEDCDGLDPAQTVCFSSAQSVGYYVIKDWNEQSVGSIDYRYSSACDTIWSEVNAFYPTTEISAGFDTTVGVPSGSPYTVTLYGAPYPSYGVTYVTSKMMYVKSSWLPSISASGSFTSRIPSIFSCNERPSDCTPIINSFWGSATYGVFQ